MLGLVARIWHYLANLQWTERVQHTCIFCDHRNIIPVYQDEHVVAFENIRLGGQYHWLITPLKHIRDIESLTHVDLPLLHHLDRVKEILLRKHSPTDKPQIVHAGYHRGRRSMFGGDIFWPDIVSIHHLHLHVIVQPRTLLWLFKYPSWLPLMWKSDSQLMRELEQEQKRI